MDDLALEIARLHHVKVNQPDGAHSCCGQIKASGRTQAARSDYQHPGLLQALLAFPANAWQRDVANVALNFFVAQRFNARTARCREHDFDFISIGKLAIQID
ncbi:Uncharacterised protein [Pseudomonas aeruginosa]|nr:Uncharacterised protein [Pseudomonas aeruginosa]